jgi:hypothetical protein
MKLRDHNAIALGTITALHADPEDMTAEQRTAEIGWLLALGYRRLLLLRPKQSAKDELARDADLEPQCALHTAENAP